jgi:hypothetical protein
VGQSPGSVTPARKYLDRDDPSPAVLRRQGFLGRWGSSIEGVAGITTEVEIAKHMVMNESNQAAAEPGVGSRMLCACIGDGSAGRAGRIDKVIAKFDSANLSGLRKEAGRGGGR